MRVLVAILALGLLCSTGTTSAAEPQLEQALNDLALALEDEQNLSPEFRRALGTVVTALRDERTAAPTTDLPPVSSKGGGFWERVSASADIRLRHEHGARRDNPNRNRERVRARFGLKADLGEGFTAGFRLRTGDPKDPRSPYNDLGRDEDGDGMLRSLQINFDRLYIGWKPSALEGFWIKAGKFGHPFVSNPVYGELVWDADVNPEGIAAGFDMMPTPDLDISLMAGQYLLVAEHATDEFSAFVAQASAKARLAEKTSLTAALGWYRYGNPHPDGNLDSAALDRSNLLVGGEYASDFHILNPIVAVHYGGFGIPVTVAGEYIYNTGADEGSGAQDGDENGFAIGFSAGQTKKKGDWKLFYQWQRVEQDAVFSPFSQDDFQFASGFRGHVYGVKYQLTDRVSVRGWGLTAQTERHGAGAPDDDDDTKLRFDVDARF